MSRSSISGIMKTPYRLIVSIFSTLCLLSPTLTLRIRVNPEGSDGITASPTLIYRRRLNSPRVKESLYPQTSPRSPVGQKTDDVYQTINQPNSYSVETAEPKAYISSTRLPSIPKSLRRNRARLREAISQESSEDAEYTTKPAKVKTGRRRKVKRPTKIKPIPAKVVSEEVLGGEKTSSSNSTGGDKNLALEIGSEDGKYALIDKFFESKPSQPPGVISYAASNDFTNDNQYTLGNVKENDIWLSEGHLLVLKGGDLDAANREHWKPIDNYQRDISKPPLRIALDTDNPPPFPVFINDTGPPVFLGPPPPFGPYPPPGGFNESFDPSRLPPPGLIPLYPNGSIPEYFGPPPPGFGGGNNTYPFYPGPPPGPYGQGRPPGPYGQGGPPGPYGQGGPPGQYGQGGYGNGSFPRPPFPPGGFNNSRLPPPPFFPFPPGNRNGSFPPPPPGFNPNGPPPGYPFLPPLALNPNDNETDDPSIFLPPPYDFDYQDDNSTLVPAGPFAPGLVVPPPKNFYTVYNKTTRRPTFAPPTGLSYSFGKRPQRPNGKKPKFPITNPPDDSEESYLPVTTPYPYVSDIVYKKRKQRPGKANKDIFGAKYESQTDNGKLSVIQPQIILPEQVISQRPFIDISGPSIIQNTIATTTTTLKPLNNYVYVRGQLKSLAELNAPQEGEYDYEPTPRPPFDERGYPSRIVDDNEPLILQYHKKTTEVPAKSFYYNTPKYDAIYNNSPKKSKSPNLKHQILNYAVNQNQNLSPIIPPSQSPIVIQQETPSIYTNRNNNQLSNQGQNIYNPSNNNFQGKITPVDQTYYTRPNVQQQRPQIIELQSPKSYSVNSQRQPHLYNHANIPQNLNYQTTSAFRPAYAPNVSNLQSQRPKFPGQVNQGNPIFNFQTPLYQQQRRPQIQGYYSPVSQYYQPLEPNNQVNQVQQQQDNYYQSPISGPQQRYFGGNRIRNRPNHYQKPQEQQPYYNNGQSQSVGNNQQSPNPYNSQLNQFIPQSQQQNPIQQDVYVNYREPLPQYNTESEAVTTRALFKAGPSPQPLLQAGSADQKSNAAVPKDGSYYSFERGGPGGFSYKIRL